MDFDDRRKQIFEELTGHVQVNIIGRPDRDTIINDEDILNLKISLNITNDVNEFVRSI